MPPQWWLDEWLRPTKEASNENEFGAGQSDDCGNKKDSTKNVDGMEDVYAVGLQEVVDLNAVNVTIDTRSQVCEIDGCCRQESRVS